ncbi:ribonuclease H-like domain-containing protein [Tanacetum coccineum]|uniref:Ribonuclease H-like domain-containing protein n=1 Tax=Tanacetum coccineum TaxID=301880 RepID=A0ABQ5IDA7_9ASTR
MASHDQQWYMDSEATSHLSSHTGNLQTSFLNRNFHSVIVGNESSILVTHPGHVQIPNPYRPFHLRNVLVTSNIIKNFVSVRKFTTANKRSIDFDPYGFTIRDYHTRQTLLRCDSTGDLYPLHVVASAFALLTNNHSLWHQRLGHPGDAVIQTLSLRGLLGPEGSPVTLYRSLTRSLEYLTFTRPDLSYAVQQLCLYMHDPREPHLNAMKRVLRYLRGTTNRDYTTFGLLHPLLIAYSEAIGAVVGYRSAATLDKLCVSLGDNLLRGPSKRQDICPRSSAEPEYRRGVANAVAKHLGIRQTLPPYSSHQRLIVILHPTTRTIDSLMQLELSTAMDVESPLVSIETQVMDVVSSLEIGTDEVQMIGIKGMGGAGKTTTAKGVFDNLSS